MNIKTKLWFPLACVMIATGCVTSTSEMRYRGSDVFNPETGIFIMSRDKRLIGLSNSKLHYHLMLPYSNAWVFDTEEPYHLKGNAGLVNMSLMIGPAEASPDEELEKLKKYLETFPGTKIDLITHKELTILRAETDAADINSVFKGVKHVNFHAVKQWGSYQYVLHLSKVVADEKSDPVSDELMLDFVTLGFNVDFQREQDSRQSQPRSFELPQQQGRLILNVPSTWKQTVERPPNDRSPTIKFTPAQGDDFEVLITPFWSHEKNVAFNGLDRIRFLINGDLKNMLSSAVETEVPIQEFKSASGTGLYFVLTDKAPKPGEYPYAVRAGVGAGDLLLYVTALSRSKDSEGITATIKALQEAKQIKN